MVVMISVMMVAVIVVVMVAVVVVMMELNVPCLVLKNLS